MKTIVLILIIAVLSGCSYTHYNEGELYRFSIFQNENIETDVKLADGAKIKVKVSKDTTAAQEMTTKALEMAIGAAQ